MTTDNCCFYLQNRLIQTSQTEGQPYSDTSPFSIPCHNLSLGWLTGILFWLESFPQFWTDPYWSGSRLQTRASLIPSRAQCYKTFDIRYQGILAERGESVRLTSLDSLVQTSYFSCWNYVFLFFTKQPILIRRATALSLPLQYGFCAAIYECS